MCIFNSERPLPDSSPNVSLPSLLTSHELLVDLVGESCLGLHFLYLFCGFYFRLISSRCCFSSGRFGSHRPLCHRAGYVPGPKQAYCNYFPWGLVAGVTYGFRTRWPMGSRLRVLTSHGGLLSHSWPREAGPVL